MSNEGKNLDCQLTRSLLKGTEIMATNVSIIKLHFQESMEENLGHPLCINNGRLYVGIIGISTPVHL